MPNVAWLTRRHDDSCLAPCSPTGGAYGRPADGWCDTAPNAVRPSSGLASSSRWLDETSAGTAERYCPAAREIWQAWEKQRWWNHVSFGGRRAM